MYRKKKKSKTVVTENPRAVAERLLWQDYMEKLKRNKIKKLHSEQAKAWIELNSI